ncbi:MAG: NAD(P)-dependent glycerol-3-phosphate dehydrogenase [Clostridia bacterium]|nr:NAD(P)-dependent glycerol-3-phosphate dehydrogenase [Clostridia bacterium]MBR2328042.1 NAD(P)-dependent glycerol-3-phosphate dehydrogenase [Clostridia bacterium]
MANIAVLGSGGWGTAMAIMTAKHGHRVSLWSKFQSEIDTLSATRENPLLKGALIPKSIELTSDIACTEGADIIILAVPSVAVRSVCRELKGIYNGQTVVNIGKGLEESSLMRLSEVINEELSNPKALAVMSGPSHAEEVARGIPTANVVASKSKRTARYVQNQLMNESFRLYTTKDIVGTELGGALKNVIALAAGTVDGLGLGDNTKAALMTRGIAEIARLGVKMGGDRETFSGLAGIGDLIVTCTSMHSRNRRCGILIGKGVPASEAVAEIGMTVEGYKTASAAYRLAIKEKADMPIITEIYRVLYENKSPKEAITDLMLREKKSEREESWK